MERQGGRNFWDGLKKTYKDFFSLELRLWICTSSAAYYTFCKDKY